MVSCPATGNVAEGETLASKMMLYSGSEGRSSKFSMRILMLANVIALSATSLVAAGPKDFVTGPPGPRQQKWESG